MAAALGAPLQPAALPQAVAAATPSIRLAGHSADEPAAAVAGSDAARSVPRVGAGEEGLPQDNEGLLLLPSAFFAASCAGRLASFPEPAAALARCGAIPALARNLAAQASTLPQVGLLQIGI